MPSNWKTAVSPKEVLDLSKDVSMIIEQDKTIGFFTINLVDIDKATAKAEGKIKFFQMVLDKIDSGLTAVIQENKTDLMKEIAVKQKRDGGVKHMFNLEIQKSKEFIEMFKIKKMFYTSIINEKDLSKLGGLLLTKMRIIFSNLLEITEELVSLGRIQEREYMEDAKESKYANDRMEELLNIYNKRTDLIITNMNIKVVRR
jgi:hypothetical protein